MGRLQRGLLLPLGVFVVTCCGAFNVEEYKVWQNWTTGPKRPQNGCFQWRLKPK